MTNAPIHRLTGNAAGKASHGVIFARETQASQAATIRHGDPGQAHHCHARKLVRQFRVAQRCEAILRRLRQRSRTADGTEIMADGLTVVNSGGGTDVASTGERRLTAPDLARRCGEPFSSGRSKAHPAELGTKHGQRARTAIASLVGRRLCVNLRDHLREVGRRSDLRAFSAARRRRRLHPLCASADHLGQTEMRNALIALIVLVPLTACARTRKGRWNRRPWRRLHVGAAVASPQESTAEGALVGREPSPRLPAR